MNTRLEQLEDRLTRTEGQLRGMRWTALVAIVGAACLAFSRPGVTDQIGTEVKAPFTVVSATGTKILRVESIARDRGRLVMYDIEGRPAVQIETPRDGATMSLRDVRGAEIAFGTPGGLGAFLHMSPEGSENPHRLGFSLLVNDDGSHLALMDWNSRASVGLGALGKSGFLQIAGENGRKAISLDAGAGGGSVELFDGKGERVARQP